MKSKKSLFKKVISLCMILLCTISIMTAGTTKTVAAAETSSPVSILKSAVSNIVGKGLDLISMSGAIPYFSLFKSDISGFINSLLGNPTKSEASIAIEKIDKLSEDLKKLQDTVNKGFNEIDSRDYKNYNFSNAKNYIAQVNSLSSTDYRELKNWISKGKQEAIDKIKELQKKQISDNVILKAHGAEVSNYITYGGVQIGIYDDPEEMENRVEYRSLGKFASTDSQGSSLYNYLKLLKDEITNTGIDKKDYGLFENILRYNSTKSMFLGEAADKSREFIDSTMNIYASSTAIILVSLYSQLADTNIYTSSNVIPKINEVAANYKAVEAEYNRIVNIMNDKEERVTYTGSNIVSGSIIDRSKETKLQSDLKYMTFVNNCDDYFDIWRRKYAGYSDSELKLDDEAAKNEFIKSGYGDLKYNNGNQLFEGASDFTYGRDITYVTRSYVFGIFPSSDAHHFRPITSLQYYQTWYYNNYLVNRSNNKRLDNDALNKIVNHIKNDTLCKNKSMQEYLSDIGFTINKNYTSDFDWDNGANSNGKLGSSYEQQQYFVSNNIEIGDYNETIIKAYGINDKSFTANKLNTTGSGGFNNHLTINLMYFLAK